MDSDDLEELSHRIVGNQAVECRFDLVRALRIGPRKRFRTGFDPEADQPFALGDNARHLRSIVVRGPSDRFEIDMSREVLLARAVEHRRKYMAPHRLERVARTAALMAVVDDDGSTAIFSKADRDRCDGRVAHRRNLVDFTVSVKSEAPRGDCDLALGITDELPHRQRIEELVGNQEERLRGKLVQIFVPVRTRQDLFLRAAKDGARLDEVHFTPKGGRAKDSQRVARKRPPPWSELGEYRVRGRSGTPPLIRNARADDFAEHLADFRRGREIAMLPERVTGRIIISVAALHERFDTDWPLGLYSVVKRPLQWSHETDAVPTVGSTRTRRRFAVHISHRPPMIIGSESHWPMCSPVACANFASWLSGSRMNSIPKRKQP